MMAYKLREVLKIKKRTSVEELGDCCIFSGMISISGKSEKSST